MPGFIARRAFAGAASGSRFWTVVAVATVVRAVVRRLGGDDDKVLYRYRLEPGDVLVISGADEEVTTDQG